MPAVDWFRKHAKALKQGTDSEDEQTRKIARDRCLRIFRSVVDDSKPIKLMTCQHVVAVECGFRDWHALISSTPEQQQTAINAAKARLKWS